MITAIIGHGCSPTGKGWGPLIDACGCVIRMWDWHWQTEADYGTRYDYGLFEATPKLFESFQDHNKRQPAMGWVASLLWGGRRCKLPPRTELIDQVKWTAIGTAMGGVGDTGRLEFTRGTIAACWAIEKAKPGDEFILVGFDNTLLGKTLPLDDAFPKAYQENLGSFPLRFYIGGVSKYGNHDHAIELPVMEHLARRHGVTLKFSQNVWT